MANDEYDKVELPAIQTLQALGWSYISGLELSPENENKERHSFRDVILEKRLTNSLKKINPWINDDNIRKIIYDLTRKPYTNLLEANEAIWNNIVKYISVSQDLGKGNQNQTVKIIDFDNIENNDFLVTNQFKIDGGYGNIIPDLILFINGLPIGVIECKSPYTSSDPIEAGIEQLRRYANLRGQGDEGCEKLFHFNQLMISTSGAIAKVGTISSNIEHYLEWKDPYPYRIEDIKDNSQTILLHGLCDRKNILDIIQNFTVFENDNNRKIKKIPRYQQYRGVLKTIERLKTGTTKQEKSGVIWHTQGSGKSLTMLFLTFKIRRDKELSGYKLVFLTDRKDLDRQLSSTFSNVDGETVNRAASVNKLRELLSNDASDLITSTIQKFQENSTDGVYPLLNASDKVIILADEAHRTQYGGLGAAINQALPNAPKIAFTGTPLIKTQKTNNEFGSYIDTYTIEQAVNDGATVQIVYEGREAKLKVTGDSLDILFDEYFSDKSDEEKAEIKKKFGTQRAILEAPQRIRHVCIDIIKHFEEHIKPNGFKAMIVTASRNAAIIYKQMLDELNARESAVIISGKHNDETKYHPYTDSIKHEKQIKDFKKPFGDGEKQSNLSFLIVKDMLLTGFDAPICQAMYIDRMLSDHNLLQAIARVNRTAEGKSRGFIVDYFGLSDYLTEALEVFSSDDIQGALKELKDEIPLLKNAHTRVISHFKGIDLKDTEKCVLELKNEEKRHNFQSDFLKFSKQMDVVLPSKQALPFISDLKALGKIALGASRLYRDNQISVTSSGEKVRKLIEEHVYSLGIDPKIKPVELFDIDFKKKVDEHKSDQAKASEIEYAIKHHISIKLEEDPVYYKSLAAKLEELISKFGERWNDLQKSLFEFYDNIEINKDNKAKDLGLNTIEYAFYGILMEVLSKEETLIDEQTHLEVLEIVKELVKFIDEATQIIDFFKKQDEQKEIRRKIRQAIFDKEWGTPAIVKAVSEEFMSIAKKHFND